MRVTKDQSRTTNEFQRSNSTTNAFIGGTQKTWMTGQFPKTARDPSIPKVSAPKATDQASKTPHRAELSLEINTTVENKDSTDAIFGPNFDRGRYPARRPRHGAIDSCISRPSSSPAAGTFLQVLSPPAVETNAAPPGIISVDVSANAENVFPSPSPSVEARRNSVNAVDIEDKEHQAQTAEAPSVKAPTPSLEELVTKCGGIDQLEKLLKDAGKGNYGPGQIAASAAAHALPAPGPSNGSRPRGRPPGSKNQRSPVYNHGSSAPLIANKRPQGTTDEPRKRLQSFPGSLSIDVFALPSATTLPPSQNGQNRAPASPSGTEMHILAQNIAQRIQLVANLSGREGSHVERPRLGLLREACENSDLFYLVLHQLFCFEHQIRKSNGQVPNLSEMHVKGLKVVAFLLVSNEKMVDDAVAWFSVFPLPWGDLLLNRKGFGSAHAKVLRCLEKMAMFWADMRSQCSARRYPPLVDELVALFNVESFLFQQIIFRAVLRDIWCGEVDDCFQLAEEVFNRDYKAVMSRLSLGSTAAELAEFYQRAVVKEYQQVMHSHWQHTASLTTATMTAPVQQQNQSHINRSSNNRNESWREHNATVQSPPTPNTQTVQHHNPSTVSGPGPIGQIGRQGNLLSQTQVLASSGISSGPISYSTSSPTTMQGFSGTGVPMNSPGHWNSPLQQIARRKSSTARNVQNPSESMLPSRRTSHMVPSNVPGNPHMHQFHLNVGPQQQTYNQAPSSSVPNHYPHAQSDVRRSMNNRTSETTLPTLNSNSFLPSNPSLPADDNSAPFIRSYPPLPTHPNPTTSALHQAHLRSPTLSYLDPNKDPSSTRKCFRFIKHILMPPEELDINNRHVNWEFCVNKELTDWFARDAPSLNGAPPIRTIVSGSRLCRIRCISLKDKAGMPTQSEWAVADNVWPYSTAIVLNGTALDMRKKTHHGKDLPIDVTRYIKAGQNNLSSAVIGFPENSTSRYAIGVEFIQVVDEQKIKHEIETLPWLEARKRILDQSKNLDPEVEVVQSQKVLDLTDPFTSCIFEVPVRGINCRHNQCFDRDTFLQTRISKVPWEPCGPDEFRVSFIFAFAPLRV